MIDLHIHSTYSDGTCTPREIVKQVTDANLYAFSLTDHDTVEGISHILKEPIPSGIGFVPGIELSCDVMDREIHVLGYGIDPDNGQLNRHLQDIRAGRLERNEAMIRKFRKHGIMMTLDELQQGNPNTVVTRGNFARYLVEHGHCSNKNQAFKHYLGENCKFYLPKPVISPKTIIDMVKDAGGISLIAHPFLYSFSNAQLETLIEDLVVQGLDGIEVYHSSHHAGQVQKLREYQKQYNLLASGGSDFHGQNKPDIEIGVGRGNLYVPDHLYDNIINQL